MEIVGTISGTAVISPIGIFTSVSALSMTVSGQPVSTGTGGGVTAHSALTGLTVGDDHTQYSLVAGTKAFTGTVGGVPPTSSAHLATKGYVDSVIDEVEPAIIGDNGFISVSSGTNTISVRANAILGANGITVTSGTYDVTLTGFRSEFVAASGSLQGQIDGLDSTYATDAHLISVSGHLQTQINSVESSDVDSITASGTTLAGNIILAANTGVYLHVSGQTITVSGTPATTSAITTTLQGAWRFDSSTTAADPGTGDFRLDNATLSLVTNIYVNDFTARGVDVSAFLGLFVSGYRMYVQQEDDANRAALFQLTGAPVDNGGWWTIPVITIDDTGTLYQNNKDCSFVVMLTVSDHGALTGLGDDDHPQYILVNGTRSFTGSQSLGGNRLTNFGTLEGVANQISTISGAGLRIIASGTPSGPDIHIQVPSTQTNGQITIGADGPGGSISLIANGVAGSVTLNAQGTDGSIVLTTDGPIELSSTDGPIELNSGSTFLTVSGTSPFGVGITHGITATRGDFSTGLAVSGVPVDIAIHREIMEVAFQAQNAAGWTWTNMPLAITALGNNFFSAHQVDLTNYRQTRLCLTKTAVAGAATAIMFLGSSPLESLAIIDYTNIASSALFVPCSGVNALITTAWFDILPSKKADNFLLVVGSGGNGTLDPQFGGVYAQFRK